MEIERFNQKELLSEITSCFDAQSLEDLARSSGFIKRSTSQLTGQSFLMMNVFDTTDGKERSLTDSCDWLEENFGLSMTKQSLDERYNTHSVNFIKSCFEKVLRTVNKGVVERTLDLPFSKVQITDATSFRIPDNLSTFYKGFKGKGGPAILKIHLNYNFLNGGVEDILLTDGAANDNKYKLGKEEIITPNALYMRDLGYFDLKRFRKLEEGGAYFLSRAKSNCTYYKKEETGKFQKIDITDYLPSSARDEAIEIEQLYVGSKKDKTKVRLILQAVPQQVALQRLERLKKQVSRQKRKTVSEQAEKMCHFNIFITNAPADKLPANLVRLFYTIRWQVELLFKIWKSVFKIDQVKKMSIFRFECYIYSKLTAMLLTLHIHNKLGQFLWEEKEFELSPMKAAKVVKKNGMI